MNEKIKQAVELAKQEYKKEYGEDAKLENGDEFVTVFNDGVLIMGLEDTNFNIKFILGEPYKVDFSLGMYESEDE
ncbi:hypothetical protein SDC9_107084 [bioreactor metagenome]|uniref:Uncharacterized protein n=1 Tax=bioreactor metagenome TaxID=1076179 RepID=A0A645BAQ2_9ZZZZ